MNSRVRNYMLVAVMVVSAFTLGFYFADQPKNPLTRSMVEGAEKLFGLQFADAKNDSLLDGLRDQLTNYQNIRKVNLPNSVPSAQLFNPIPLGMKLPQGKSTFKASEVGAVELPSRLEDIAFYSVGQLAELIRAKKITSVQLTQMYIARLKKYDPMLHCVITLTEDLAMQQAKKADEEIASGLYRGPLHGIPYGAKDLLATKGIRTTWGAAPFKDSIPDEDATVIKRLHDAGAVLVAKLSMGELAMDDIWFGGKTRNPWDTSQGSSGSSAGSASATSAGLVGFSIGTETWGSIVSPSTVCGVTGLRPTYGRVSRHGAMALSGSMDHIGPICRTVEDCALVFNAIEGTDPLDQTLYDVPFSYDRSIDLSKLRIGYLKNDFDSVKENKPFDESVFAVMRSMGVNLVPIELPKYPFNDIAITLTAEAAAEFDDLTRNGKEDMLARQDKSGWPNIFRTSRFIPAVEYIQANRIRYLVVQDMWKLFDNVDVYLAPSLEGDNLLVTNLTGNPCVVLPTGFTDKGLPVSITFMGKLFGEGQLLAVAKKYQDATTFHLKHPPMFK